MTDGSIELSGKVTIRHVGTPVELLGRVEVGQNSAVLLGKGDIQQSGSAELLGRFEAQTTAELLGNAIIRQTGSAELFGKLRASIPGWVIQGVSVEAYIDRSIVV